MKVGSWQISTHLQQSTNTDWWLHNLHQCRYHCVCVFNSLWEFWAKQIRASKRHYPPRNHHLGKYSWASKRQYPPRNHQTSNQQTKVQFLLHNVVGTIAQPLIGRSPPPPTLHVGLKYPPGSLECILLPKLMEFIVAAQCTVLWRIANLNPLGIYKQRI